MVRFQALDTVEVRHHRHTVTVDEIGAMLADVPDGTEVTVRAELVEGTAITTATRLRRRLGVDFYVRVVGDTDTPRERVFSVLVRKRLDTEPVIRGTVVRPGPHWKTFEDLAALTGLDSSSFIRRHCLTGHIQRYRFGQRVLFKTEDVDALLAEHYGPPAGGAIVAAATPTTERTDR